MSDILNNKSLKDMHCCTPEGYFPSLQQRLKDISVPTETPGIWKKVAPKLALAAMFVVIVSVGTILLSRTAAEDELTEEDYLVFSEDAMNTIFYDDGDLYAEAITEDDVIEYLIYTGTEIDELY
jgi:hypothetical protein